MLHFECRWKCHCKRTGALPCRIIPLRQVFNSFNGSYLNWLGYYLIHGITLFKQGILLKDFYRHLKLHLQTLTEALNIKEAFTFYPHL